MGNAIVVTIGMPAYNVENYIGFAIKSILHQSFSNFELVIIDDGSSDNTAATICSFKDERIKFISYPNNLGIASRLNEIIKIARGKYFARMDADDLMFPERLKIQVEYLDNNPHINVLGTNAIVINEKNNIIGLKKMKSNQLLKDAFNNSVFIHPTVLGHLNWFKENPYDELLSGAEDYELFLRTFPTSNFFSLDEPLLFYRDSDKFCYRTYLTRQKMKIRSIIKNRYMIENLYNLQKLKFFILVKLIIFKLLILLNSQRYIKKYRNNDLKIEDLIIYQGILSNQMKY